MQMNELFCLVGATELPNYLTATLMWLVFGGCMILPWVFGWLIARSVKMPTYGIHIGFILWLLAISTLRIGTGWPPKLGIDLKGGVILEYEVFPSTDNAPISMDSVVSRIEDRLNSSGLKEISIRAVGNSRIEVIVPDVEPSTVLSIKEMIHKAGLLEFRIVADPNKHRDVIAAAEAMSTGPDALNVSVPDAAGVEIGKWVGLGRESTPRGPGDYKIRDFYRHTIRDANTGKLIRYFEFPSDVQAEINRANRPTSNVRIDKIFEQQGYPKIEILMATNDGENVKGEDLSATRTDTDERGEPEVVFRIRANAASRFASLTSTFKPDPTTGARYHLGIILDDELLSAPTIESTISDNGRITGRFTQQEVKSLVEILEAGTMPAKINKQPLRESQTSPLLGEDMIRKSGFAMAIASALVLVFMVVYYRLAGLIACLAVVANLFFTIALMIAISAALTLTGIAGMVLTIGMAVDANVLIYERMREETAKGASLRMAIRNGFDRAFTTILDSNLTTILTAVILYFIGTAQVKGFAVTLVLGIATSMFTACYATRILFDIAERTRMLKSLKFAEWIGTPKVDYVKIMVPMTIISVILIVIGMGALFARGKGAYDIDFSGGTSVHATLEKPKTMEEVRERLTAEFANVEEDKVKATFTLTGLRGMKDVEDGRVWKIDSSLQDEKRLQEIVKKAFSSGGKTELVVHHLTSENYTQEEVIKPQSTALQGTSGDGKVADETEKTADEEKETPGANEGTKSEETPAAGAPATPTEKSEPTTDPANKPTSEPSAGAGSETPPTTPKEQSSLSRKLGGLIAGRYSGSSLLAGVLQDGAATPESASPGQERAKPEEGKPSEGKSTEGAAQEPSGAPTSPTESKPDESKPDESKPDESKPEDAKPVDAPPDPPAEPAPSAAQEKPEASRFVTKATLEFDQPIDGYVLREQIKKIAESEKVDVGDVTATAIGSESNSSVTWLVTMRCDEASAKQVVAKLKEELPKEPVWASSDKITGQVAADAQKYAFLALVLSCVGIVVYVWFRFDSLSFGFAAVVALIHDVLITLAAIGISAYIAPFMQIALIDEFKLNLPVIAAILTLIGYSINDTIVTFDRIREVRGKSPRLTADMINLSVNQTMARTILTFSTVFIVVVILYIWGGESIHGFAFCMVIGSIAGVYSSIFIASPLLLLLKTEPKQSAK